MSTLRERASKTSWGLDERELWEQKEGIVPPSAKTGLRLQALGKKLRPKPGQGCSNDCNICLYISTWLMWKLGWEFRWASLPASAYWNNIFTTLAHTLRHSFTFNWELGFRVLKCCSTLYAWTQNLGYSVQNVVRRWWTVWYLETESMMRWWKEQLHSFCESSYSDDSWNQFRHLGQLVKLI